MAEGISSSTSTNYLSMIQSATNSVKSTNGSSESEETKTSEEILNELRQDGLSSNMTAQEIADKYGISLSEAQEILEKLNGTEEKGEGATLGYTLDNPIPEDSTVSYHV